MPYIRALYLSESMPYIRHAFAGLCWQAAPFRQGWDYRKRQLEDGAEAAQPVPME